MARRIVIDPVTRIEGRAKITIYLDDSGQVADARFHVAEFRGFERFCVGRPFWEMPGLTSRVCGICPVSHLLTSAKAGDQILGVEVPSAAVKLRRVANLAQIIQSHALSFFHLSAPDLLFGMESPPADRNLFGLIAKEPEFAKGGIRLRQFGQQTIERLGGKRIHAPWVVPGGVTASSTEEGRAAILAEIPDLIAIAQVALDRFRRLLDRLGDEIEHFGNFPTLFLALVGSKDGGWEHYEGDLRLIGADGGLIEDAIEPMRYRDYFGESTEDDSYLKSPFFRPLGFPGGCYRVGPLARINVCANMQTVRADQALSEFRDRFGRTPQSSFLYHYARLIEILASLEWMERSLADLELTSSRIRAEAGVNRFRGVGVGEAPRGTLFHDYEVDANGVVQSVNLMIATGQNSLSMNRTVAQIARRYVRGEHVDDGMLNRVEAGIRAFDPCLSCSTHAVGQMPLVISIVWPDGRLAAEICRREGE